jgi:superfamily II DNA or RNA helicase
VNRKFNPAHVEEDFFIPVRGDKSSKIDTLPGASNMGDIQDIEYLENKLFAALKVPKPYLNYAESMAGGSMLSQADLRFARTINSIQESVLMELRRIANIHLMFTGFEDDIDNFTLSLTNPSTQQELLNLETWRTRLEIFKEMKEGKINSIAGTTGIFKEGINIPILSCLILGGPINNDPLLEQVTGRVTRPLEGKMSPQIIDIVLKDRTSRRQFGTRLNYYISKGYKIVEIHL